MADCYSLVMDCIQYVQDKVQGRDGTSTIQLSRRQCEHVAQELLQLSQSLRSREPHDFDPGIQRTALLHLHATVKRAQMLVERCCCEKSSWLHTGITMGDTREEVITIVLDLHQWKSLLDIAICASSVGSSSAQILQLWESGEEGYQRLSKKRSKMQDAIRDVARQDQEELLEKLVCSGREEDQRGDDYVREVYLRSWLNPAETGSLQSVQNQLKAYTILKALGKGASGTVLQVKWLGQELALKKLEGLDATEATALGRLQHPNIVRLFHHWEEDGEHVDDPHSCIIMELMPMDLQKHIRNVLRRQAVKPKKKVTGGMPFLLPVAIDTMLQVAQAMRELHEMKLTHRDLKTSNVLVKPVSEGYLELHSEGYLEVKLADFGLARAYENTSQTGDLTRNTGTTIYGAPEIFEKEKVLRERNFPLKADVWSFGMTCSEILSGKMPFADDTDRPTLHSRIKKNGLRPSLPEGCPEYLQFCIRSCWELQPQKRPSFFDLCRMLRHAKLLSLGLMDVVDMDCVFAYPTYSAHVLMSGVRPAEDAKMSRVGLGKIWRNLRRMDANAKLQEPSISGAIHSAKSSIVRSPGSLQEQIYCMILCCRLVKFWGTFSHWD